MRFRHSNDDENNEELNEESTPNGNEVGSYNGGYDYDDDDDEDYREPRRINFKLIGVILVVALLVGGITATKVLDVDVQELISNVIPSREVVDGDNDNKEIPSNVEPSDDDSFMFEMPSETTSEVPSQTIEMPSTPIQLPDDISIVEPSMEPSQPIEPTEINVTFSVEKNENGGKPIFTIHTNLPDNTRLLVTLSNSSGYKENQEHKPQSGILVTNEFTNNGNALPNGNYSITIKMLNSQFDSVKALIGENYEMLKGDFVQNVDGRNIAERTLTLKLTGEQNLTNNENSGNIIPPSEAEIEKAISDAQTMAELINPISPSDLKMILSSYNYPEKVITPAIERCGINWNEMAKKILEREKPELMKETNPEVAMKEYLLNEGFDSNIVEEVVNASLGKQNNNDNSNGNFTVVG